MRSRAVRVTCGILSCGAILAAAVFLFYSEQQLADRRAAARVFDLQAREASDALSELGSAQQAYVADGQGVAFWLPKVDATTDRVASVLTSLDALTMSAASKASILEAAAALTEFGKVDRRVRSDLEAGARVMAANLIFNEGRRAAAEAARHVEEARLADRAGLDAFEAARRRIEVAALSGAGALALLVTALLLPRERARDRTPRAVLQRDSAPEAGDELLLRQPAPHGIDVSKPVDTPPPTQPAGPMPALQATAALCTDLGRVTETGDLSRLMGRVADALNASGVMLWESSTSGADLHPSFAHGYSADTLARMPTLETSAPNAVATAFRTGVLQVVRSRPSSQGAIAAPVLSPQGSIGVLSAEIRGGGEASETVHALAIILAAQLAAILPAASDAPRASAGGA
jgi:hypothetical protein